MMPSEQDGSQGVATARDVSHQVSLHSVCRGAGWAFC